MINNQTNTILNVEGKVVSKPRRSNIDNKPKTLDTYEYIVSKNVDKFKDAQKGKGYNAQWI